jgi:GAF domain-containing protein
MTALPQDVMADLSRLVAELKQRLESSFATHDEAIVQQAAAAEENARLRGELATTRDRAAASSDILRVISQSPTDVQPVFDAIVQTAVRLLGCDVVAVLRRDDATFSPAAEATPEGLTTNITARNVPIDPDANFPSRAIVEKKMLHLPDYSRVDLPEHERRIQAIIGVHSALFLPLLHEDECIGVLALTCKQPRTFSESEIALAESYRDQALIAIENVRLFNETYEALERQIATAGILDVIASSPSDVQPIFEAIVKSAAKLFGPCGATITTLKDGKLHWNATGTTLPTFEVARAKAIYPIPFDPDRAPSARAMLERRIIEIPDVADPDTPEFTRRAAEAGAFRSITFVPLVNQDKGIGTIILSHPRAGFRLSEKQLALIKTFADQAVIAIENARLFDEVQARTRDLSESLQQQTATADVLKVISRSTFDLQTVLETLIKSAVELSGANRGSIFLREGDVFPLKAASNTTPEFLQFWAANPPKAGRGSATSRVIASGKIEIIPDVLEDPEMEMPASSLARIRATLGVPMLRDNNVEGVLVLTRPEPGPFTKSQIDLVQTFADQAVIAVENVRLFDEAQARTQELAASLDELRTAQDRLVQTEKLASLGQLTAGIAHEIKNPLNFVNNFAALSAELTDELNGVLKPAALSDDIRQEVDELTAMLKGNLEKVVQHGKRADSIVKNMLLHSREGSGEHRPTDINALLDESLNLAYHGARAEKPQFNVTLRRDFDPNAGLIEMFPQEITRVFLNLITNGFYAVTQRKTADSTGFEPTVSTATRDRGSHVEIRIRDNGTGIPPEVREKMFNPFFTTKPAGEGTGLGLSMSHDIIVKQHGGTIGVDTEPGEFTEFTILLPRTSHFSNKARGQT